MARSGQRRPQRSPGDDSNGNSNTIPPVPPIPPEALSMNPSTTTSSSSNSNSQSVSPPQRGHIPSSPSASPTSPSSQQPRPQHSSSSPHSPHSPHSPINLTTSHSASNTHDNSNELSLPPSALARTHTRTPSSEYYPSWLPRRPLAPAPPASTTTTLAYRRTPLPFQDSEGELEGGVGDDGDMGPYPDVTDAEMDMGMEVGGDRRRRRRDGGDIEQVGRAHIDIHSDIHKDGSSSPSSPSETESTFIRNLGGRRPTPRSVRIVSLPHSPASPSQHLSPNVPSTGVLGGEVITGGLGPVIPVDHSRKRERETGNVPFHKRVWSRATGVFSHRKGASRPGLPEEFAHPLQPSQHPPTSLQPPQPPQTPQPPKPKSIPPILPTFTHPSLNLGLLLSTSPWFILLYRIWPLLVLIHIPIQIWLDFSAGWVLVSVTRYPSPSTQIQSQSQDSSRSWALATAAYLFCSIAWLFGVVVLYEGVYGFVRRWRVKRPLVMPIYLSSIAFNYAAMSSYGVFCFLMHVRWSVVFRSLGEGRMVGVKDGEGVKGGEGVKASMGGVEGGASGVGATMRTTGSMHPNDPSDPVTVVPEGEGEKEKEKGRDSQRQGQGQGKGQGKDTSAEEAVPVIPMPPVRFSSTLGASSGLGGRGARVGVKGRGSGSVRGKGRGKGRGSGYQYDHSAYGGWKQFIAESCWWYSQNLPTVALLMPRAGLVLALLFAFSGAQVEVVGTPGTAFNPATARDPTYFRVQDGSLTGYARGVLIANAVWAAWRIILVIASWIGLWFLSGHLCAGICGPRYRWEEEEYGYGYGSEYGYGYGYGDEKKGFTEQGAYPYTIYAEGVTSLSPYATQGPSPNLAYARRSYPMPQTPTVFDFPQTPGGGGHMTSPRLAGNRDPEKGGYSYDDDNGGGVDEYEFDWDMRKRRKEESGPGLPWRWREMTKMRVRDVWEFCFVVRERVVRKGDGARSRSRERVRVGGEGEGEGGAGGFEGIERVLAAVGFPSVPPPARRGVLRDDLFVGPEGGEAGEEKRGVLTDVDVVGDNGKRSAKSSSGENESPSTSGSGSGGGSSSRRRREKGKKRELQVSPYPFSGKGAQVSSEDEPVPFPPSPGPYQEEHAEDETGEEHAETSDEPTSASSSSRGVSTSSGAQTSSSARRQTVSSERASESMSSLGQPVTSRYPFQFRRPPPGNAQHSHSGSQSTGPSGNDRSGYSYMTASTGNRESTDSSRPRYSISDASASVSVSLGSPLSSPGGVLGQSRGNRQSLGAESAMSASIPMPPRHPGPQRARGRGRAGSVPSSLGGGQVVSYYSSGPGSPISPDMENPPPSPTPSLPFPSDNEGERAQGERDVEEEEEEGEGAEEGRAESEDVVGLLGQPTGPSPKSSFTALRHRASSTLSLSAHPRRTRRSGSRSATNSISGQSSSGSASRSRSRAGSMISVHVRSRTQSLLQGLGAASHSSLELVQATFGGRSRANSSMARLSEDAGGESDIQSSRPSMTRERGWVERARREETQTHSRSGSGNISDAVMSSMSGSTSAGTSGGENYTFGHPLRTHWHDPEREAHRQEHDSPGGHVLPSPIPESPRSASPTTEGLLDVPHRAVEGRTSHPSLLSVSSPASVDEGTVSGLTPRQMSEEPELPRTSRTLPIQIPAGRRELAADGGGSSGDMISTADQSFVTAPATVEGQTTDSGEARTVSSWGGVTAMSHAPRHMSQPGAWGPA